MTRSSLAVHPLIEMRTDPRGGTFEVRLIGNQRAHSVDAATLDLIRKIHADAPLPEDARSGAIVAWLQERGYVVSPDLAEVRQLRADLTQWEESGWEAAARYHFETYGYPFERYSRGQSPVDTARMNSYVEALPDLERGKSYAASMLSRAPLESPASIELNTAASYQGDLLNGGSPQFDHASIQDLLSLIALPVQRDPMPWPHSRKVLRKTSPSGGSRHPTEIYFVNSALAQHDIGVFHINADEGTSDLIHADPAVSKALVELVAPANAVAGAALVLTSRFARNRFRYREPRTFRTVHMDVGHLMTTAEYTFEAAGYNAIGNTQINARLISSKLSLDPLIEHPIAGVAILSGEQAGLQTNGEK